MNSVISQEIAIERESLQSLWRRKVYREKGWPKYQKFLDLYTMHEKEETQNDFKNFTISLKYFFKFIFLQIIFYSSLNLFFSVL